MPLSAAAAGVLCARLYGRGLSATSCGLDLLIALCMYSLLLLVRVRVS
jgi:thymidine phosphorylase